MLTLADFKTSVVTYQEGLKADNLSDKIRDLYEHQLNHCKIRVLEIETRIFN